MIKRWLGSRSSWKSFYYQAPLLFAFSVLTYLSSAHHTPFLQTLTGWFLDRKFQIRGTQPIRNKIVIVGIDEKSIESLGHWPWNRRTLAHLLETLQSWQPASVGFDIIFSEPENAIPDDIREIVRKSGNEQLLALHDGDAQLIQTVQKHKETTVLGWIAESPCIPATDKFCTVLHPEAIAQQPTYFPKFSIPFLSSENFQPERTPLMSLVTLLSNIPSLESQAKYAGFFNAWPDTDGVIRRTPLFIFANGKAYPSLPLAMWLSGTRQQAQLVLTDHDIPQLVLGNQPSVPLTSEGWLYPNFRGPAYTYPYVSAIDVLESISENIPIGFSGERSESPQDLFRGAHVLIGAVALGLNDTRTFSFDPLMPGVEGHATVLDNLLAQDTLTPFTPDTHLGAFLVILFLSGLFLCLMANRLNSTRALTLFPTLMLILMAGDLWLFRSGFFLDTSLFYLEFLALFAATLAIRYVSEENEKKFIHQAFGRYLSPKIVDQLIENPDQLRLGGERRELTLLFSDIRGFTDLSEKMKPTELTSFLNEYLGLMTHIITSEFHGTLDKYIGDAIMAFWGAPVDVPESQRLAFQAALKMQHALVEKKEYFRKIYGLTFESGIGIHFGPVSVGNMGSEKNLSYTAIGDTVNLASRLEGLTRHYHVDILTTLETLNHVDHPENHGIFSRILDTLRPKGKQTPVVLVEITDRPFSPDFLSVFHQGREHYTQGDWEKGIAHFDKALKICPLDGPTQLLRERCRTLQKSPPEKWAGIWEMKDK